MKDYDIFNLKLSEAKDLLTHINDSIRETRNRLYFLLAIIFAVFGFTIDDIFLGEFYSSKSIIFYSISLVSIYIFYQIRQAITPLGLRFNGISPENFDKMNQDSFEKTEENIFFTYNISIQENGMHLASISKSYNRAFKSLLIWVLVTFVFLLTKWIIQSYVC